MTFIIIFAIIVFLLLLLLILPIEIDLSFNNEFSIAIYYGKIKVFNSKKEKTVKVINEKQKVKKENKEEPKKENKLKELFNKKRNQDGTISTLKYFLGVLLETLKQLVWFIKKIDFKHFVLNLTISTDDAAKTAIEYGTVCTAIYPILSLLTANSNLKLDKVNISADFDKTAIDFSISCSIKIRVIYLVIAAIKVFIKYKKFIKEGIKNE